MKIIHSSLRGFTSRTDSQTANSVVIFKGRFSLQEKKAKVLLGVPAHRADCKAAWRYPSNSALAAARCRSRAFSIGQFTPKDSLMWLIGRGLFRIQLCIQTSLQVKQCWFCSMLLEFWFISGTLPPHIFETCNNANGFCWYSTLSNPFWKIKSPKSTLLSWRKSWESLEECSYTRRELTRSCNVLHTFCCYL